MKPPRADGTGTLVWAAATALGGRQTTRTIAEFVGLHRLLSMMVEKGWTKVHIVGGSEMILNL
ncbi:hypothetical protein GQ600_23485 [Phytophthora cactorum]|nr:hypothetical protein GQ600_23485 [Phytophthora cactorum]KAG3131747.1 hypothetical protein C6341_g23209 [Phytophthora cactorum]